MAEIVEGKDESSGRKEWPGIRGAPAEIVRFQPVYSYSWSLLTISVEIELDGTKAIYSITAGFNPHSTEHFRVQKETLTLDSETIYDTFDGPNTGALSANLKMVGERPVQLNRIQPVLTQLQSAMGVTFPPMVYDIFSLFRNTRFLEFIPEHLRQQSERGGNFLGDFGQNLPSALEAICRQPDRKKILLSWLHELIPMDVQDFEFPWDSNRQTQLLFVERSGRKVSAASASDGTLRFLGLLTALLGEQRAGVYMFEDLDAGIHPARLWLLLDFIERQTAKGDVQVITTTHSPALLTWINDTSFEHTSIVYRDENWADSIIRPISDLPGLKELRKSETLGELFTENWMENILAFSKEGPEIDHTNDEGAESEG